jgi:hypothetical protein
VSSDAPQTVKTPSGLTAPLSPDETRLALLGMVDFEGDWDALEAATSLVVDGAAKAGLIRDRLASLAAGFTGHFVADVNVLDLLAARHWFDTQPCQTMTRSRHAGEQGPAASRIDEDEAGAHEERA